ncbi:MAG TPA: ABC transporter substrate-binding protein [Albitalea sp.]|uniref:ABC transporter substrate-binding protein n=1 Tax=Piscinibacter sp. TaxID=1903157 RepID=UPI002ED54DA5
MAAAAHGQTLDVLHWWTSAGERRAVDRLVQQLERQGVAWNDAAIPGGAGVAAMKVLKSRVLAGDPRDVAQVIGRTLTDWADLGLVLPLDDVAQRGRWKQAMFPVVLQVVSHRHHVIAAPLGVHRINTLLYHQALWARLKLGAPRTWDDVEQAATALRKAGLTPLAWSDEPWQVATVFETLLLGEGGPTLYAELASAQRWQAWQNPGVLKALVRLRWLRGLNGDAAVEQPWTHSARQLYQGQAGMFIMGDWASGELKAWGAQPGTDFGCAAVPGTAGMHLYSIDTLAMLVGKKRRDADQDRLAELLGQPAMQLAYNQAKGSVPVRTDIDPAQLDECARDSWQTLARPGSSQLPSIAHRMSADESTKDALAAALHRFIKNRELTPEQTQARLVTIIRGAARIQ